MSSKPPTPEEIANSLSRVINELENNRRAMLRQMATNRDIETQALLGEKQELAQTLPANDPQILALESRIRSVDQLASLARTQAQLAESQQDVGPDNWIVAGRLVDAAGRPQANVPLQLIAQGRAWRPETVIARKPAAKQTPVGKSASGRVLGKVTTDPNGEFFTVLAEKELAKVAVLALRGEDKTVLATQKVEPDKNRLYSFSLRLPAPAPPVIRPVSPTTPVGKTPSPPVKVKKAPVKKASPKKAPAKKASPKVTPATAKKASPKKSPATKKKASPKQAAAGKPPAKKTPATPKKGTAAKPKPSAAKARPKKTQAAKTTAAKAAKAKVGKAKTAKVAPRKPASKAATKKTPSSTRKGTPKTGKKPSQ